MGLLKTAVDHHPSTQVFADQLEQPFVADLAGHSMQRKQKGQVSTFDIYVES